MSDLENKNGVTYDNESVDDILAAILNPDGSFNEEFNGLLKKYVGGDTSDTALPVIDISDRRDEMPPSRVEYEAQDEQSSIPPRKNANERIEEKIPDSIRTVYAETSAQAQRPEFTSTGDVRYPTMGVGAAEERVIFDADWEDTAKKEAARLERVRQDRMLRGDSAYARTFNHGGTYIPRNNYFYADTQSAGSEYIDPLSRDADFEGTREGSLYYSSAKKSFFPEGFSVTQKNNSASGGKTERMRSGSTAYMRGATPDRAGSEWLQVEEKPAKKGLFSRKKKPSAGITEKVKIEEDYEGLLPVKSNKTAAPQEESPRTAPAVDNAEISAVEQETAGLRSTVAEIVDKYNKRSEEDERKRLEEKVRLVEERRRQELIERRRAEELRVIKEQMSPEFIEVVESAEAEASFDEYDDFSTEPAPVAEAPAKKSLPEQEKSFSVVFDPSAFDDEDEIKEQFVEKISSVKSNADEAQHSAVEASAEGKRKKTGKNNRRKDS